MQRWWFLVLALVLAVAGVVVWVTADEPLLYGFYATSGPDDLADDSVLSLSTDQWVIGRQRALGLGLVVLALVVAAAGTGYRLGRRRA